MSPLKSKSPAFVVIFGTIALFILLKVINQSLARYGAISALIDGPVFVAGITAIWFAARRQSISSKNNQPSIKRGSITSYQPFTYFIVIASAIVILVNVFVYIGYLQEGSQSVAGLAYLFSFPLMLVILGSLLSTALRKNPLPPNIRKTRLISSTLALGSTLLVVLLAQS